MDIVGWCEPCQAWATQTRDSGACAWCDHQPLAMPIPLREADRTAAQRVTYEYWTRIEKQAQARGRVRYSQARLHQPAAAATRARRARAA